MRHNSHILESMNLWLIFFCQIYWVSHWTYTRKLNFFFLWCSSYKFIFMVENGIKQLKILLLIRKKSNCKIFDFTLFLGGNSLLFSPSSGWWTPCNASILLLFITRMGDGYIFSISYPFYIELFYLANSFYITILFFNFLPCFSLAVSYLAANLTNNYHLAMPLMMRHGPNS